MDVLQFFVFTHFPDVKPRRTFTGNALERAQPGDTTRQIRVVEGKRS